MKYRLTKKQVNSYLPKPFYFITTRDMAEFDRKKIRESLLDLKNCGFNGFILFNKPPKGFDEDHYLNDDWFTMVKLFTIEAKKLKLEMWINDGYDYPPGGVGGQLYKLNPNLPQKRIVLENGVPTVKEVDWGYPAFENPLSPELFHQLVHEKYKKHVGKYFGNPIVGFFTDGDNRRVQPGAMLNPNHPGREYFPWSDTFEETFKAKYGYDIMPFMVDVLNRKDIKEAVDYWEHAGHLYQSWFISNTEWLHQNGLLATGHTGDTSPYLYKDAPRGSSFTEGRFSDAQNVFDFPGTDQELLALDGGKHMVAHNWYSPKAIWGNEIHTPRMERYSDITQDLRAKQTGSTAFIYNKKEVMCEMFAASNYGVSPAELKQIAAFQITQGVTFIVEHAYHYRYYDWSKYFAPPEFSSRAMIGTYINELNHELAELACMMSIGKSVCPIALLDPTEATWRNNFNHTEYFDTFAKLNRLPYGYAICDIDNILNNNLGFKVAIVSGWTPDKKKLDMIKAKGIMVIDNKSLDKLKDIIPCGVSYVGEGTPHFVRKVIDGEEFTFIANIENETPIRGKIIAYGREKEVLLYQGDVRYISARYDDIPDIPVHGEKVFVLPNEVNANFDDYNRLALERWESNGKAVVKTDEDKEICFPFTAQEELSDNVLYFPKEAVDKCNKISFDGEELNGEPCLVYDEAYVSYKLPLVTVGEHTIEISRNEAFNQYDVCFMNGNFDVVIASDKTEYKAIFREYNLTTFIPENATVVLSKRRNSLKTDTSWALQGQPFYSGKVTYSFNAELPEKGAYRLVLPKVRDVVEVYVDNKLLKKIYKEPYEFEFKHKQGTANIKIEVVNSFANAMEFYLEESGILNGGYIEKV